MLLPMPLLKGLALCGAVATVSSTLLLRKDLSKLVCRAQSLLRAMGLFFGAVVVMRNFGEAFNV